MFPPDDGDHSMAKFQLICVRYGKYTRFSFLSLLYFENIYKQKLDQYFPPKIVESSRKTINNQKYGQFF